MPTVTVDSSVNANSEWDDFFRKFSWAFLNFAAKHHVVVDKYWHDLPCWRFSFRHPKGGLGCIGGFREAENQIKVFGYWWLDDFDEGTRNSRRHESESSEVESSVMLDLLEEVLDRLVSWPLNSWTEIARGLGKSWKEHFSKEKFEQQISNYPVLKVS